MMQHCFQVYPLGHCLADGMIRERMERTVNKILHHINVQKDFLSGFVNRKEIPDAPGGFVGCGMLLDAIVKAAVQGLGGKEMTDLKENFIDTLIRSQSADGAISIFSGQKGIWDNHEQAYIVQALVWDSIYFRNEKSLDAAAKLGHYLITEKTRANIGIEQALLMLYEQTHESEFLNYCVGALKIGCTMDEFDDILPCNGTSHVYTYLARNLAQLKYAELSGTAGPRIFDGIHEAYDRILHRGYAAITGGITGGDVWGELWDNTQIGLRKSAETCAAAYLLRLSTQMFAKDGDPVYGDIFERTMYNTFFAAQSDDGCSQKYFIPFNEAGEWYKHDTYCCPNNFRRMVFELPQAVFFKAQDGIVINLYNAAELNDELATLKMTGDYPASEKVELQVMPKTDRPFALYFRVPRWCKNMQVQLGEESFTGEPGSLLKIERVWDVCYLRILLPMQIRFIEGTRAQQDRAAVLRGPVVYGWKIIPGIQSFLARFEPESGLQYENGKIIVHASYRCCGIKHRTMELIPFYRPERDKTYFLAPDKTEPDELFRNDEN